MITADVASNIAKAETAELAEEYECQERALNACETIADWQACCEAFGERVVGSYIADNAEDQASNGMGDGCAYVTIAETAAAYVEWNDQGFYSVDITSIEKAAAAVAEANEDYAEAEEDDAEAEEYDAEA